MKKIFIDGGARLGESIDIIKNEFSKYHDFEFYLFEPNNQYRNNLENLQKNNTKVKFIEGALWDKNGKSDFFISNDIWGDVGSTLHIEKKEKLDIKNALKVTTYDIIDVIGWFSEDDYIVLKLDVEGSEYDIINRLIASNNIFKIKEYLVEWHDHFYDDVNKNKNYFINEIKKHSKYNDWLY
jgi:FkbM family methyltransferase